MKYLDYIVRDQKIWGMVPSCPVGLGILAFRPLTGKLKKHIPQRTLRLGGENFRPFQGQYITSHPFYRWELI